MKTPQQNLLEASLQIVLENFAYEADDWMEVLEGICRGQAALVNQARPDLPDLTDDDIIAAFNARLNNRL